MKSRTVKVRKVEYLTLMISKDDDLFIFNSSNMHIIIAVKQVPNRKTLQKEKLLLHRSRHSMYEKKKSEFKYLQFLRPGSIIFIRPSPLRPTKNRSTFIYTILHQATSVHDRLPK